MLWDFRRALETARELERLNCYWLEKPLPRYAFGQIAELNRLVALPLAGGENNRGLHEFREMLSKLLHDPPIGDYRNPFSIFEDPPVVASDGTVAVPKGPGLGVSIRRDLLTT